MISNLSATCGIYHGPHGADRICSISGISGEQEGGILRGWITRSKEALVEPVWEVPVARDAPVVREYVEISVDGLGILGAGVPGAHPGVIADVVEDALAVVVGHGELRVGRE